VSAVSSPPTDPALEVYTAPYSEYAGVCLRIRTKEEGEQSFAFNRPQKVVDAKVRLQLEQTGRVRVIILKARQMGISTWIAGRFWRAVHLRPSVLGMVLADRKKRAEELFQIYDRFRLSLPEGFTVHARFASKNRIALSHDSGMIVDTAGDVEVGRALTLQRVHASEVGFWEKPEEAMLSLLQAVPPRSGEVFLESTANGVGNYFHRVWEAAGEGETGWLPIFLPWWIHDEYRRETTEPERRLILATADPWERMALDQGIAWEPPGPGIPEVLEAGARWNAESETWVLAPEQLAWRRDLINEKFGGFRAAETVPRGFRQEHPSTAREAFLVSGNCFFDEEALVRLEELARGPVDRGNLVPVGRQGFVFRAAEKGYVRVWEPPDPGGHYVIGADTAQGLMAAAQDATFDDPEGERGGRDFNSGVVIRVPYWRKASPAEQKAQRAAGDKKWGWVFEPPRVVAEFHARTAPEVFAEALNFLGKWYSCPSADSPTSRRAALAAVERNHDSGQTVIRVLRERYRYPNQFVHRQLNKRYDKPTEEIGWRTTGETRMPMLDELAEAIRSGGWGEPSGEAVRECLTFVRGEDGRPEAQEGCHDDRVISRAIALQMIRHHSCPRLSTEPNEPEVADTPTGR